MRLSIIIPIYNKDLTILKCLESINEQLYESLEIILIDDGSSDRSVEVAQNYLKDTSIMYYIIQQENRGPAAARNRGLEIANGEYIMFVDADDYLLPGIVEQLIRLSERYGADLVECGFGNVSSQLKGKGKIIEFSGRVKCMRSLLTDKKVKSVVWASLYKRNAIKDVRFIETMHLGEDTCFKISCLKRDIKVVTIDDIFYINITDDSKTLSRKKLDEKDVNSVIEYLIFTENEIGDIVEVNKELYNYLYRISVSYYARMVREDGIKNEEVYKSLYGMIDYYEKKMRNLPILYYFEMKLLRKNKKAFKLLYRTIKGTL